MNININDLKEGNLSSFDELYSTYKPRLFTYIYQKTESEYYADEVVQVTFVKLWEKRSKLRTDIPLSAQIFQIAKSSLIDIFRKVEREKVKLRMIDETNVEPAYGSANEDEFASFIWTIAAKEMPPVRGRVFMLRVKDQLSYEEISNILNISVKTVGRHINLAFQQIRPLLPLK